MSVISGDVPLINNLIRHGQHLLDVSECIYIFINLYINIYVIIITILKILRGGRVGEGGLERL